MAPDRHQPAETTCPITATTYSPVTLTATIAPESATPNIHYVWVPVPDSGQGTATVVYQWTDPGVQTVYLTAKNAGSSASTEYQLTVSESSFTNYLPLVLK